MKITSVAAVLLSALPEYGLASLSPLANVLPTGTDSCVRHLHIAILYPCETNNAVQRPSEQRNQRQSRLPQRQSLRNLRPLLLGRQCPTRT